MYNLSKTTNGYGISSIYTDDLKTGINYNKSYDMVLWTLIDYGIFYIYGDNSPLYTNTLFSSRIKFINSTIISTGKNSPLKNYAIFTISDSSVINVNSSISFTVNRISRIELSDTNISTNCSPSLNSYKDASIFYYYDKLSYEKQSYINLEYMANITFDKRSHFYYYAPIFYVNSAELYINFAAEILYYGSNLLLRIENRINVICHYNLNKTVNNQTYDIYIDETSSFYFYIRGIYRGSINKENLGENVYVELGDFGKWIVTGNSYVNFVTNYTNINDNEQIEYDDYNFYNATGEGNEEE